LYYYSGDRTWRNTHWMGTPLLKCPLDLWIYQELIYRLRPDVILETGTNEGGSARFLAQLMDLIGKGRVITVDIRTPENLPKHQRITYIQGSSIDEATINKLERLIQSGEKVMVILDSDHGCAHVLQELRKYSKFVSKGSYLIVEDSNVYGHPVLKEHGPGPMEALRTFLNEEMGQRFKVDESLEKYFLTFNPSGYLKRIES
jgi:cephalosporin hydroxylase